MRGIMPSASLGVRCSADTDTAVTAARRRSECIVGFVRSLTLCLEQ